MTDKLWTKNYILLIIASAFSRCSFDILLPTLPLFLTANGTGGGQVGIVMGSFTFSAILVRFFVAEGSRRYGMKRFLYVGLAICTAISLAYNLGTTFISATTLRVIHGFGFGIATTLAATIAAGVIPVARRGEGFGFLGFGGLLTAAIAPFVGLWLLENHGSLTLFAFTALTQIGCILCISQVLVKELAADTPKVESFRALAADLFERPALFPAFLAMLQGIGLSGVICFIALFSQELSIANVGWFFLASTAGTFIARLFSGRIFDYYGRSLVIIPGVLLCITGMILIAEATSLRHLITAALLFGAGGGAVFPSLQAWIMNRVAPNRHNQANALFYNAFDIGIGGGSIVLGFIVSVSGYRVMYLTGAATLAVMLGIYLFSLVLERNRRQGLDQGHGNTK